VSVPARRSDLLDALKEINYLTGFTSEFNDRRHPARTPGSQW